MRFPGKGPDRIADEEQHFQPRSQAADEPAGEAGERTECRGDLQHLACAVGNSN